MKNYKFDGRLKLVLESLPADEVISRLKHEVSRERESLVVILHYLMHIQEKGIDRERGYSSLHGFVVGELGYSADQAQRRVEAVRLLRAHPEVQEKIESGSMSLTTAAKVQ